MSNSQRKNKAKGIAAKNLALNKFRIYCQNVEEHEVDSELAYNQLIQFEGSIKRLWEEYSAIAQALGEDDDVSAEEQVNLEIEKDSSLARIQVKLKNSLFGNSNCNNVSPSLAHSPQGRNQSTEYVETNSMSFRLPSLPAPTFSGQYTEWEFFRDIFTNMVVENKHLTGVEKFHYLAQSLNGEAKSVILNLTNTAENFDVAWSLLCQRYNNSKRLASSYINALEKPPEISLANPASIRNFVDHYTTNVKALKSLKLTVPALDLMILHRILSHCPPQLIKEWERHAASDESPSLQGLYDFLERTYRIEENCQYNTNVKTPKASQGVYPSKSNESKGCPICNEEHTIFRCQQFRILGPTERLNQFKTKRLCFNCCKPNKPNHVCSPRTCMQCSRKHHTLLHTSFQSASSSANLTVAQTKQQSANVNNHRPEREGWVTSEPISQNASGSSLARQPKPSGQMNLNPTAREYNQAPNANVAACQMKNPLTTVLLPTALVAISDSEGKQTVVTALLDTGSNCNLISQSLVEALKLPTRETSVNIRAISKDPVSANHYVTVKMDSMNQQWSTTQNCLIVSHITKHEPLLNNNQYLWGIPQNISLADPQFNQHKTIHLLLGVGVVADATLPGLINLGENLPKLQNTVFGWTVSGAYPGTVEQNTKLQPTTNLLDAEPPLDQLIEKFWKVEEVTKPQTLTSEENYCKQHYQETTTRNKDGRYVVSLPKRSNINQLGESKAQAIQRFRAIEAKMTRDATYGNLYQEFMKEYEELGHMTAATAPSKGQRTCYLPHHAVVKQQSTTSKIRVVFDASAKTNTGISLNQTLYVGPKVQPDLFHILLNFRTWPIAYVADIEKMYRQILMEAEDRDLQRIIWRQQPHHPLIEYRLNTVTYGTASAAYLATQTLNQLAEDETDTKEEIKTIIQNSFYVDNLTHGSDTEKEAKEQIHHIIELLEKGGFKLRKWMSNSTNVLEQIPHEHQETTTKKIFNDHEYSPVKTLGLHWHPQEDVISLSLSLDPLSAHLTKRRVLSQIARIYDPLGLFTPVTIATKIFMQDLWRLKIGWDDELPSELECQWKRLQQQLENLPEIRVQRKVRTFPICSTIQIHGFCDASSKAYSACLYVVTTNEMETTHSELLCSKTRIAPIKSMPICYLELNAAQLLARLCTSVLPNLSMQSQQVHLYSDSTTVHAWLKANENKRKQFVAHRVTEIQELTHEYDWHYVPTKHNPADLATRGISPDVLKTSTLWWQGPQELMTRTLTANCLTMTIGKETIITVSNTINYLLKNRAQEIAKMIENSSSYEKTRRSAMLLIKFIIKITKMHEEEQSQTPTLRKNAELLLIRIVQWSVYAKEIKRLAAGRTISKDSKIHNLCPELHHDGVLRLGGRLSNSKLPYEAKHQAILPAKHPLTSQIIRSTHQRLLHAGAQQTIIEVRQKYWIPSLRRVVKSHIRGCITCFKQLQQVSQQVMGQLPETRTTPSPPFYHCGIDYAGPILIKSENPRSKVLRKVYLAFFVCFSTKAVNIEIVTSLSTQSFLAAFRRFTGRRGIPAYIHSDNASTFKGANRELQELAQLLSNKMFQDRVARETEALQVNWSFIPPRSPNFGGLWEATIKAFKRIFRTVMCKTTPTYEELTTITVEIEAILNSRPLIPVTDDPEDLNYLSPAHFLIQRPLTMLPNAEEYKVSTLSQRWKRTQQITNLLWKQWLREYLQTLQHRSKWRCSWPNIEVGTLVLIKDLNAPPSTWTLGRVTQTYPGRDNRVRVLQIKTKNGLFKRSIHGICPLPLELNTKN